MSRVSSNGRVSRPRAPARDKLRQAPEPFRTIDLTSDEMRALAEECFPGLLGELPPKMPPAGPVPRRRRRA